ncbi:hypothetical protein I6H48_04400 [Corynebacterium amycolatum]|uniref:Uncharacterized protein n=1 Tax=Corynebacterium amycolatum TaxID=43765 RepID=A0AB37GI96_CORAY|nr:hypothetical protein [Corynebacterium amycolatum]QPR31575.1 hypothetical protein I6G95_03820 [Corynebacterium amycolatum]QQB83455.1 hypothetical protein I6H48_04400 [Corynebacterium amycolatum]
MSDYTNAYITLTACETIPLIQEHMPDRSPEGAPWEFEVQELITERIKPNFRRALLGYIEVAKGVDYVYAPDLDKEVMLDAITARFGTDTLLKLMAKDSFTLGMKVLVERGEEALTQMLANLK